MKVIFLSWGPMLFFGASFLSRLCGLWQWVFPLLLCDMTCQLFECIYSFLRYSAKTLWPLKWGWDGFMMTMGGWSHMPSLFCSALGGTHKWQPTPLGSRVGHNAHTLASLVMVRWKRSRAATGRTFRLQVKPWIWWMKTVTNIPYGKEALPINAAAGRDKGHVMYVNVLLETALQCDRLLSGGSADLACAISSYSLPLNNILYYLCASNKKRGTYLLWQSITLWDSRNPYLRFW